MAESKVITAGVRDALRARVRARRDQRDGNDSKDDGRQRVEPVPQGSWLLLRYDEFNHVAPVASGDPFWESPDIWFDGGDGLGNAIPGQPTRVRARIWNSGTLKANPTKVYFAYVDASLGIPWTQPRLISKKPSWANVPELILGPGFAEVQCKEDWIPAQGSTHACLFVMCSCAITNDVPSQPWSPSTDRHVAQHNVTILAASAGETMSFRLHMTNITPSMANLQLGVQAAWVAADKPRDVLRYSPNALRNTLAALNLQQDVQQMKLLAARASNVFERASQVKGVEIRSGELADVVRINRIETLGYAKNGAVVIPSMGAVRGLNGFTPIGAARTLRPLEHQAVHLDLRVPPPVAGAQKLLVRVAQFENGYATGGYTFIVVPRHGVTPNVGTRPSVDEPAPDPETGAHMDSNSSDMQALIIEHNGLARLTFQIVSQLSDRLPIRSLEELVKSMPVITIDKHRLSMHSLETILTPALFPVHDLKDLVVKVSAATRIALGAAETSGAASAHPVARMLLSTNLQAGPGRQAAIPAGHFTGPSLFGSTRG